MFYTGILKRPYEVTCDTQIQIRLLQFLGEVNESDSSGNEVLEISSCLYPAYWQFIFSSAHLFIIVKIASYYCSLYLL